VTSLVLVLFSCLACFYYIRLVKLIAFAPSNTQVQWILSSSRSADLVTAICLLGVICFILKPDIVELITTLLSIVML
jgi:NADH:ubiquinone oxidoreductase subunit 2 (subunit N)